MASRTAAALAVVLVGLWGLAGCKNAHVNDRRHDEAPPRLTAKQAQRAYSQTLDEIARASLRGNAVVTSPSTRPEVVYFDGETQQCTYTARVDLDGVVFGENVPWDAVRTATEDARVDDGFTLTDQLDIPGGYNGFDARTNRGAQLEVRSKIGEPSSLTVYAPVTGTCSSEVNETLKPLGR